MEKKSGTPCPQCGKPTVWETNPFRPFCSERCKLIDLGQWASEKYRIPHEKPPSEQKENEGEEEIEK